MKPVASEHFIPLPVLILGWAGVIPFAALTAAVTSRLELPVPATTALVGYACAILSFMAGAQWGLTVRADGDVSRRVQGYATSVIPALVGWVSLLIPFRPALILLVVAFGALFAYDLWTVARGIAPGWYGSLRTQLTAAVVASLSLAAVAA